MESDGISVALTGSGGSALAFINRPAAAVLALLCALLWTSALAAGLRKKAGAPR